MNRRPTGRSVVVVGSGRSASGKASNSITLRARGRRSTSRRRLGRLNNNRRLSAPTSTSPTCSSSNRRASILGHGGRRRLLDSAAINRAHELSVRALRAQVRSDRARPGGRPREIRQRPAAPGVARPDNHAPFRKAREIARARLSVLVRPSTCWAARHGNRHNERSCGVRRGARPSSPTPLLWTITSRGPKSKSIRSTTASIIIPAFSALSAPASIPAIRWPFLSDADHRDRDGEPDRVRHGALCAELGIRGLISVQYIVHDEALRHRGQPRASRTVPIIAKLTGVPLGRRPALRWAKACRHDYRRACRAPDSSPSKPMFSFAKLRRVRPCSDRR